MIPPVYELLPYALSGFSFTSHNQRDCCVFLYQSPSLLCLQLQCTMIPPVYEPLPYALSGLSFTRLPVCTQQYVQKAKLVPPHAPDMNSSAGMPPPKKFGRRHAARARAHLQRIHDQV
ncbi:hypothetical protein P692DRAFT_20125138 [Suillus brevipes Sb2]|nr:hypothetical protein P692DRAFT_20125138 [Suillus brevipes Sb2]